MRAAVVNGIGEGFVIEDVDIAKPSGVKCSCTSRQQGFVTRT
jgi:hypothetical protein